MELEKTHRGEDRYLVLVTQEHQVLKDEKSLQDIDRHGVAKEAKRVW